MDDNPGLTVISNANTASTPDTPTYPLDVLQEKDPEKLPQGIDPIKKEVSCSQFCLDTAFFRVSFAM